MKKIKLTRPPEFLVHHLLLSDDRLGRLKLPTVLTQIDAQRISDMVMALAVPEDDNDEPSWPFARKSCAIKLSEDDFPDVDMDEDDDFLSDDDGQDLTLLSEEDLAGPPALPGDSVPDNELK